MNYYNEHDKNAAAWLRELIRAGEISDGVVDERDIQDVKPTELSGFNQCHFFAGIGGWSLALRLAGVPDDARIWSGSCPCQPFSLAGGGLGEADERHLWPDFRNLIGFCRPPIVIGEQVAKTPGFKWLAGIRTDLERAAYAVGAGDLCAAGLGAPHIRQRIFWMAHDTLQQSRGHETGPGAGRWRQPSGSGRMRDSESEGRHGMESRNESEIRIRARAGRAGANSRLGKSNGEGFSWKPFGLLGTSDKGYWSDFAILPCRDGKARRIESGTFPLAHGIPGRVGLLRGYGNAIVAPLAAKFIEAGLEAIGWKP